MKIDKILFKYIKFLLKPRSKFYKDFELLNSSYYPFVNYGPIEQVNKKIKLSYKEEKNYKNMTALWYKYDYYILLLNRKYINNFFKTIYNNIDEKYITMFSSKKVLNAFKKLHFNIFKLKDKLFKNYKIRNNDKLILENLIKHFNMCCAFDLNCYNPDCIYKYYDYIINILYKLNEKFKSDEIKIINKILNKKKLNNKKKKIICKYLYF